MKKALLVVLFAFVLRPVYAQNQPTTGWTVSNGGATVSTDTANGINSVGIGISVPSYTFHVYSSANTSVVADVQNPSNTASAAAVFRTNADTAQLSIFSHASARTIARFGVTLGGWNEINAGLGSGLIVGTNNATPLILGTSNYNRLQIDADGTVKIADATGAFQTPQSGDRLNVNGTIRGTNVVATYQDVAEWVPATETMNAGTVVVLNPERTNEVMPSEGAYDTRVAGVVSAQPGVILGVEGPSKAKVATTGRVKVRVDASRHAVRVGDLLVTGDRPGMAMVSEPVVVGGVKMHRPGTLIGKALEPLSEGEGEILVLLSLQ